MPTFIIYLIKANIALTLFYIAYRFGLRRLTFYTLNRFFLLFGIAFSALFPLVNINSFFQQHEQLAGSVAYYTPDWSSMQLAQPQPFTVWSIIQYIFWAGVVVMTVRLSIQLLSLLRIHIRTKNGVIYHEKVKIMYDRINPFSFFKNIYINPALHSPQELEDILKHEKIHVKGWHTADVLAGEINNIFYWFNPGAWLMKTAIQENLEFITDRKILQSGTDARAYQYNLIKVSTIPFAVPVANNFNFSHLKMRIKMMNKKKSSGFHLLRYLLLLPVIAIAALIINSSRAQNASTKRAKAGSALQSDTLQVLKKIPKNEYFNEKGYVIRLKMSTGETTVLSKAGVILGPFNVFSMSPEQLAAFNERFGSNATYEEVQGLKNHADYLKAHPEISEYSYSSADKILVWEGKSSKIYNLKNAYDKNLLLKKYGTIPPFYGRFYNGFPVPAPPKVKYTPPQINKLPEDYVEFLKRNPSVKDIVCIASKDNVPKAIMLMLKKGPTEIFHLNNKKEMEAAKLKYGSFPGISSLPRIQYTPPKVTKDKSTPSPLTPSKEKPTSSNNITDTTTKNDHYYAQLSYQKARDKDYADAERYANESLKLNPDNAKAKSILKYVQQMKTYQEKMEEYNKERGNRPMPKVKVHFTPPKVIITDSSQYFASISYRAAQEKKYEEATSYAQKSLQLNPDNATAKQVLRYINQMKGYQEKMEEYKKAHKDMDSAPIHAVNSTFSINNHGLLSTKPSETMLLPGQHYTWTIGPDNTLNKAIIETGYKNYLISQPVKGRKMSSSYTYTTQAGYIINDTGKLPATTLFPKAPENQFNLLPENVLYLVNGKKVNRKFIQQLNPNSISSISVLKEDKGAILEYGPAAKEGVIKIYTKDYKAAHPSIYREEMKGYQRSHSSKDTSIALSANKVVLHAKENITTYAKPVYLTITDSNKPLILINNKITKDESTLNKMSPNEIDSVVVMKKNTPLLIKDYGAQAKNGVIKIYTKKYSAE